MDATKERKHFALHGELIRKKMFLIETDGFFLEITSGQETNKLEAVLSPVQ